MLPAVPRYRAWPCSIKAIAWVVLMSLPLAAPGSHGDIGGGGVGGADQQQATAVGVTALPPRLADAVGLSGGGDGGGGGIVTGRRPDDGRRLLILGGGRHAAASGAEGPSAAEAGGLLGSAEGADDALVGGRGAGAMRVSWSRALRQDLMPPPPQQGLVGPPTTAQMCEWMALPGSLASTCYVNYVTLASQGYPQPPENTLSSALLRLSYLAFNCSQLASQASCVTAPACTWNSTVVTVTMANGTTVTANGTCRYDQVQAVLEVASWLACPGMPFTTAAACLRSKDAASCPRSPTTCYFDRAAKRCLPRGLLSTDPFLRQAYQDVTAVLTSNDFTLTRLQPIWFGACAGGPVVGGLLNACRQLTNATRCTADPRCQWLNTSAAYGCDIQPTAFFLGIASADSNSSAFAQAASAALTTCYQLAINATNATTAGATTDPALTCNSFRSVALTPSRLQSLEAAAPLYGSDPFQQLPEPDMSNVDGGSSDDGGGLSTCEIIGIVVGSVVGFLLILILILIIVMMCKGRKRSAEVKPEEYGSRSKDADARSSPAMQPTPPPPMFPGAGKPVSGGSATPAAPGSVMGNGPRSATLPPVGPRSAPSMPPIPPSK